MYRWLRIACIVCVLALFWGNAWSEDIKKEYPEDPTALIKTTMGDIHVELFEKEAPKTVANFIELAEGKKEFTDNGKTVKKPFYDGLIFHRVIDNFMIQGGCPLGSGRGGPGYGFEDEINAEALGLDKEKVLKSENHVHPYLNVRTSQEFSQVVLFPLAKTLGIKDQKELEARLPEVQKLLPEMTLKDCYENQGYEYNPNLKSHPPTRGVLAMANSGPNTNGSQFFINLVDTPWLTGKHTVFGKVIDGMDVVDKIAKVPVDDRGKPKEDVRIISIRSLQPEKKE